MARQGPHQVAQKSISTGLSDFKTSASKFASVTSTIPFAAICFPPDTSFRPRFFINLPARHRYEYIRPLAEFDSNKGIRCGSATKGAGLAAPGSQFSTHWDAVITQR